jgi:hypothetical protein
MKTLSGLLRRCANWLDLLSGSHPDTDVKVTNRTFAYVVLRLPKELANISSGELQMWLDQAAKNLKGPPWKYTLDPQDLTLSESVSTGSMLTPGPINPGAGSTLIK